MDLGTVLSVWAHPDDETYLCGGLMADAVRRGNRVVCVTATRGELGSPDEERWPSGAPLAEVRTQELMAALAELGVTEHIWLDYPDGGCIDVADNEAVPRLRALVEHVQPDTVLTFGPDGLTGHDDHITVGRWATEAARGSGAHVHLATYTEAWMTQFRDPLDKLGVFMGFDPISTPDDRLSLRVTLDGDLLDTKIRAIKQQVSQVAPMLDHLGEDFLRAGLAEETFRPAD
jgi:LmbE family N-acetylglucosaminyl deacetylase